MNFKWLNKQGVESDSGFVVQFTGRFTAEYRERGKVFEVEIENGLSGGKPAICFSKKQFSKESLGSSRAIISKNNSCSCICIVEKGYRTLLIIT